MKVFSYFYEQAEQAQKMALAAKQRTSDYTRQQIRAGMRHRAHVHRELAHRQETEKTEMMKDD